MALFAKNPNVRVSHVQNSTTQVRGDLMRRKIGAEPSLCGRTS